MHANVTPYERHKQLGHQTTRHSPDAFVIIEECVNCPARWIHSPCIGYPVTMTPQKKWKPTEDTDNAR